MLLASICLATGCGVKVKPRIPINVAVPVKEPLFHELLGATRRMSVVASGLLRRGEFVTHGQTVTVPNDTKFWLSLSVPVRDHSSLNLSQAEGKLIIESPIKVMGISTPTSIALEEGQASTELDFARLLAGFMIYCVEGDNTAGDSSPEVMNRMLPSMQIAQADFDLIEGAHLNFPTCEMTIGKNSRITLSDLIVSGDKEIDYSGFCLLDLHASSLKLIMPKKKRTITLTDCDFKVDLNVKKIGRLLTFDLHDQAPPNGKRKPKDLNVLVATTSRTDNPYGTMMCKGTKIRFHDYSLSRTIGSTGLDIKLSGLADLKTVSVNRSRDGGTLAVAFPSLSASQFAFDSTDEFSAYDLTASDVDCQDFEWKKERQGAVMDLKLGRAHLASFDLSGNDGIMLSVSPGEGVPKSLTWSRGKQNFNAVFDKDSTLSINKPVRFSLASSQGGHVEDLPISIHSGVFTLKNGSETFRCDNVKGNFDITAQPELLRIRGDLSTSVHGDDIGLPAMRSAHTAIKSISVEASPKLCSIDLKGCHISLTTEAIMKTVSESIPARKTYVVNKIVQADRKWRYRNVKLDQVTLLDSAISDLHSEKKDSFAVSASTELLANGTVERYQMLGSAEGDDTSKWSTRPWSAKAHLKGDGELTYKFVPAKSLADSSIEYKLTYQMPVPDDLDVNWSEVATGYLGKAEKAVIGSVVKKSKYFDQNIPLSTTGTCKIFDHPDPSLRHVKVTTFSAVPSNEGIDLMFDAHIAL